MKTESKNEAAVIKTQDASDFVRYAMKRYGNEVNYNRALPRIEDGLKPIQRFLLWSSLDMGGDKFVKSAKITGHCIASYSPHADAATYGSMVNMVNETYPYFEPQGNFGGPTTEAAAPRYTEARIHPMARKMMVDLPDMKVIPYEDNYDDTKKQPVFLPCLIPNILLNSSLGIGLAISTKFPGFNLGEVSDALITYLKTNDIEKAVKKVLAPDDKKCKILSESEIETLIKTGCGSVLWECDYHIEQLKKRKAVVITGYCPEFSVKSFLKRCEKMKDEDEIYTIRNETSAKNGDRIVIEFDNEDVVPKIVKLLRKKITYKMTCLVEENGEPNAKTMGVGDILTTWTEIRKKIVIATIAEQMQHLQERKSRESLKLKVVLDLPKLLKCLEAVDTESELMKQFVMSQDEAKMILDMRVDNLKNSDTEKLKKKIIELESEIATLQADANNPSKVMIEQVGDFVKYMKKEFPELLARKSTVLKEGVI